MSTSYDKAAVVIKIDEEIVFNDFVATNQIADVFFKSTDILISELVAVGLEVKLLRGETLEYTVLRNGVEYGIKANPKIGDLLSYRHQPQIKEPNCYFEIPFYGDTCCGSTKDTRSIKIEGDDEKLAIDAIARLKAFFDDEDAEYNEEFDFAKDDDPHADGNFKLIYSLYPYIKYHSYGKIFIAEIDRFIKTKED